MSLPLRGQIAFNSSGDLTVYGSSTNASGGGTIGIGTAPDGATALKLGPGTTTTPNELCYWTLPIDTTNGLDKHLWVGFDVYIETTLQATDVEFFALRASVGDRITCRQQKNTNIKNTINAAKSNDTTTSYYSRHVEPACIGHNNWYRVVYRRIAFDETDPTYGYGDGYYLSHIFKIFQVNKYPQFMPISSDESKAIGGGNISLNELRFRLKNINATGGNPITVYIKNLSWGDREIDAFYATYVGYDNTPSINIYTAGAIAFNATTPASPTYYFENNNSTNPTYDSGSGGYTTGLCTAQNMYNPTATNNDMNDLEGNIPYPKAIPIKVKNWTRASNGNFDDFRADDYSNVNIKIGNGYNFLYIGFDVKIPVPNSANETNWTPYAVGLGDSNPAPVGWLEIFKLGHIKDFNNPASTPISTLMTLSIARGINRGYANEPYCAIAVKAYPYKLINNTPYTQYPILYGVRNDPYPYSQFLDFTSDWTRIYVTYLHATKDWPTIGATGPGQIVVSVTPAQEQTVNDNCWNPLAPNILSLGVLPQRRISDTNASRDENASILFRRVSWGSDPLDAYWSGETLPPSSSIIDNDSIGYQKGKRHVRIG